MEIKSASKASTPFRISSCWWLIIPLVAFGFMAWTDAARINRVVSTTNLVAEPLKPVDHSLTGYEGDARQLIVAEHHNESYHWIAQSQQMFARREMRVRWVDYDNAPFGRSVETPSPYRWWLGVVAWTDHWLSGRPLGLSVEHGALYADPLLHLFLLAGAAIVVGWRFGVFSAALFAAGLVLLFPLAAGFAPGAPDDRSLSIVCALWSVLALLVGLQRSLASPGANAERSMRRWFFFSGVSGGLGMWVSVAVQTPILVGVFLGGLLAAWLIRSVNEAGKNVPPVEPAWGAWAGGGAVTILLACLIDYDSAHLSSWQLRVIHPLYGVAWLGLGGVLVTLTAWIRTGKFPMTIRSVVVLALAVVALAALPVMLWKLKNEGFLATSVATYQLTKLHDGALATTPGEWLLRDGFSLQVWTVLVPMLLVLPAGWLVMRRQTDGVTRVLSAFALGPVLLAFGLACWRLNGWTALDGVLLVLLVATTGALGAVNASRALRWSWAGVVVAVLVLHGKQFWPSLQSEQGNVLSRPELVGLIERDMARWLAKHAGVEGAVVLGPPNLTTTLYYYAGLRGLGTAAHENQAGLGVAIRILSASTPEEAKELIDRRGVNYIVIPSWDDYLDEYARVGMGQLEGTFLNGLHLWKVPGWLRPVDYQLPAIDGFGGQTVKILQVVEEQDETVALSRTAEYFIEMGQLNEAGAVGQALRRFPADLGSLVARAQVEIARGDTAAFAKTVDLVRARLANKGDRGLPWDRRVSLAVVLARYKQTDQAKTQVERCLKEADAAKLRMLTTGALYRLHVLAKAYDLSIADASLRSFARDLLPVDLRSRL